MDIKNVDIFYTIESNCLLNKVSNEKVIFTVKVKEMKSNKYIKDYIKNTIKLDINKIFYDKESNVIYIFFNTYENMKLYKMNNEVLSIFNDKSIIREKCLLDKFVNLLFKYQLI